MSHDETRVELPDRGIVVVTGPNGAGKSALVEAFAIALWGRGTRSARWQPWRSAAGHVMIDDGRLFARRRWTGKSKALEWGLRDAGATEFDTTTKAQDGLDQVVGSFEAWRRTSVFSSADAAHFTLAADSERKELLEELLGLGWFDRALVACRKDLHVARTALGVAERDRDLAVARADGAAKLVRQATELLATTTDPGDVGLLRARLARIQDHMRDISREVAPLADQRAGLLGAGGEAIARSKEVRARLARLTGDECFTCGQEIPGELRRSLEAEAAEQLAEASRQRGENSAEVDRLAEEIEELDQDRLRLDGMQRGLLGKVNSITEQRSLRERLQREVKIAGAEVGRLAAVLLDMRTRFEQLRVDVAELEACEKVLGVRGARAHLIGRTLAGIESLANTWMSRLSSDVEIKLSPYTEKKSGGTVDSISLGLIGAGGEAGYGGASAGERRRVDVAILLALSELAGGMAQGRWQSPIFFDEVFDGLDEDGRDAVVEMLSGVSKDRLVVLITHNEHMAAGRADLRLRVDGGLVT